MWTKHEVVELDNATLSTWESEMAPLYCSSTTNNEFITFHDVLLDIHPYMRYIIYPFLKILSGDWQINDEVRFPSSSLLFLCLSHFFIPSSSKKVLFSVLQRKPPRSFLSPRGPLSKGWCEIHQSSPTLWPPMSARCKQSGIICSLMLRRVEPCVLFPFKNQNSRFSQSSEPRDALFDVHLRDFLSRQ